MSHNTEGLNASNGGEISASCLDLLMIKIQTARRKLTTVINNCDAPLAPKARKSPDQFAKIKNPNNSPKAHQ
jgi:hypothetical protein